MNEKKIIGISPWSNPDKNLMKEAGIEWVRLDFHFPFEDKIGGNKSPKYLECIQSAKGYSEAGFKIMGITPLTGIYQYDQMEKGKSVWVKGIPEWAGDIDQHRYYEVYELACMEIGKETASYIDHWQISNEMDVTVFRGPMTIEQAARFCEAGAKGIKRGNPKAKTNMNPAAITYDAIYLYERLYAGNQKLFDYAGIDGYFGSWVPGGPDDWLWCIDEIHRMTGCKVLINEWGYSSVGGPGFGVGLPAGEVGGSSGKRVFKENELENNVGIVCNAQAWHNCWRDEHSEAEQAEYLSRTLALFAEHPHVIGSFIYCWGDDKVCWHCGTEGCPAECGWGIVDTAGMPKPGYHAVKDAVWTFYR